MKKGSVSVLALGVILLVGLIALGAKPIEDKSHPFNPQVVGEKMTIVMYSDMATANRTEFDKLNPDSPTFR